MLPLTASEAYIEMLLWNHFEPLYAKCIFSVTQKVSEGDRFDWLDLIDVRHTMVAILKMPCS
jgi:hypothetical protein